MTTMNRIIYPTPEGGVAVIIPTESVELNTPTKPFSTSFIRPQSFTPNRNV